MRADYISYRTACIPVIADQVFQACLRKLQL
jgi:hypothetical protein